MISRIPQGIPIARRVELWLQAVAEFVQRPIAGNIVEIDADGRVAAWRTPS